MHKVPWFIAVCCVLISCAGGQNPSFDNDLPVVRDPGGYNETLLEYVEACPELSAEAIGVV